MSRFSSSSLLVLAVYACASSATLANNHTPTRLSETRHISYADLDLTTSAGVSGLKSRVHVAVENMCHDFMNQPVDPLDSATCVFYTRAAARSQMAMAIEHAVVATRSSGPKLAESTISIDVARK